MYRLRLCFYFTIIGFISNPLVTRAQSSSGFVAKEGKVIFEKIVFDPPLGTQARASERVTVDFEYRNETGHDLSVCIGAVYGSNDESSGCSPVKLQQGKGVGKTSFDLGWALADPSGKRVLMSEYNEETRKSTPLPRPPGAKVTSRLPEVTGVQFRVYDGSDKTTDSHVIPAKFLPSVDTVFQTSELPPIDVKHRIALAKANLEAKTIALIELQIGTNEVAVDVDIKRIKKDGTTDIVPATETFTREVVRKQVKSEVPADQLVAWSIDGTSIPPSELLVKLSKPTHVIVAPAHVDGKTLLSPYYRAVFRSDLLIIQKIETGDVAMKP